MSFLPIWFNVVGPVVVPIAKDISRSVGGFVWNEIKRIEARSLSEVITTCRRRIAELRLKSCLPNEEFLFRSKTIEFEDYVQGPLVSEKGCLRLLFEFEKFYRVSSLKRELQLVQGKFPLDLDHQLFVEVCEVLNNTHCNHDDPRSSVESLCLIFDDLAFPYYTKRNQAITSALTALSKGLWNFYQDEVASLLKKISSESIRSDDELFEIFDFYDKLRERYALLSYYFTVFLILSIIIIFGLTLFYLFQLVDGSTVLCVDKLHRGGFFGPLRR